MTQDDQTLGRQPSDAGRAGRVLEPCQDAIATLYSYLDGELTPEKRVQIQHHLEDCGPCLKAFDFENELKALIARKCRDEVPESLRRRVAEALTAEASGREEVLGGE